MCRRLRTPFSEVPEPSHPRRADLKINAEKNSCNDAPQHDGRGRGVMAAGRPGAPGFGSTALSGSAGNVSRS